MAQTSAKVTRVPSTREKRTLQPTSFDSAKGPTGDIQYFGRLARQRRGVNFLQSLASGFPPATLALRFLTLAVTAPAHHHGANSRW
jgi:hypothetical protein